MDILLWVHLQDPGFSSSQFLRSSLRVQPRQPDDIRLHTQRWMELWLHAQSMPICCFDLAFIVCPTRMVRVPLCSQVHTDLKGSIRTLCLSSWLFTGSSSSSHRNILVHQKWGWFQGGGNAESANFLNICKMELLNFRAKSFLWDLLNQSHLVAFHSKSQTSVSASRTWLHTVWGLVSPHPISFSGTLLRLSSQQASSSREKSERANPLGSLDLIL